MMDTAALLDAALSQHRAGHLDKACALYDRVLSCTPGHADALHLSGLAAHQAGNSTLGLRRIRAALSVQPEFPVAQNSLGSVLADLGRSAEAIDAFAIAIAQNGGYAEAHGNLGTVLQSLGRLENAELSYRRAATLDPGNAGPRVNLGVFYRETGRIAPAAHWFHEAVKVNPGHAAAWHHLAICLHALRHPDAEACLRRALGDTPADAELASRLATLLAEQRHHAEAETVLGPAVAASPENAELRFALGNALYGQGRLDAAVAHYREALTLAPGLPGACNNLGVVLLDLGEHAAALPVLRLAVMLQPADALLWNNLGTALDGGRRLEAADVFARALRLRPDYGKALNNLGNVWKAWKRPDRAETLRRKAVAAQPDHGEAYANLAALREADDDMAGAERLYRRGLRLDPRNASALTGYGLVLQVQGRMTEAEAAHRKALSIDNRNAEAHANLGMMLWQGGADADTAEAILSHAIDLDSELAPARLNRGMIRLTRGDLTPGWEDYRWRLRAKGYNDRPIAVPLWAGEDLAGRRLMVWREQGVGDEILFASCWPDLIRRAGHLVIECDGRLVPLFARSFPQATVRAQTIGADGRETIDPPDVGAHVPAGDVPRLLRGELTSFGQQSSWLVPDPALVTMWRDRVAALGSGLRVGIGWRSQLVTTQRKAAYTSLDQWGAIFAVPGVVFVNLQYGECAQELDDAEARFGVRIHRWTDLDLKDDFDGAAALTANLDLVISPAMSAGELAGALGVPVWRFGGRDWTQLGTGVRPWFPSMRLFQPRPGETLEDALVAMARALAALRPDRPVSPSLREDAEKRTAEAIALYREGDAAAAERLARSVLEQAPDDGVALHLTAVLTARRGDDEDAAILFGLAVRADSTNAAAHAGQAEALQRLGRHEEAEAAQRRAIAAQPDAAGHWVNRTALLRSLGRSTEAAGTILHAIRLRPDLALAHNHRGELAEDRMVAVACYRRAVALEPAAANTFSNLGGALHALERFAEAERALGRAVRSAPDLAIAWTNRGNALSALGRLAEAEACHRTAIGRRPELAEAHANLAFLLQRSNRRDEALDAYRQALEADPKHAQAHYNLALLLLEEGTLRVGWGEHEWRFGVPQFRGQRRRLAARAWRGENIAASRLLVWREQGVGDEILFASCYGEAMKRAGHLVIECDRRLVPLFARSFPGTTVRAETMEPRDVDVQIAAGSLPRLLRPDLKRFPERPSWLVPDPARVSSWRARLAMLGPGLKIGIGWRSQLMTGGRSAAYTSLDQWGAIFAVPGVVFVNLQYGECTQELDDAEARFGVRIHRWADLDLKDDFDGAAALAANLDLVISPAMSAGELAGALGVPVWRFGGRGWTQLGTGVRPWFPSMRLFQPRPGETLEDALGQIARALRMAGAQPSLSLPPPPPPEDVDRLLEASADAHRAGRLEEAAEGYGRVLDRRPRDPVALHLSGLLAHQTGSSAEGEPCIAAALAVAPLYATAHISLGNVRLALGRPGDAMAAFQAALAVQPAEPAALSNLGNALDALHEPERAERAHRWAIHADPALAEAHDNHGAVLSRLGRPAEADAAHRHALTRMPGLVSGWMNRSVALRRLGRLDDADRSGQVALALDPALADAMANRGRLLRELGRFDAALRWCDRALAVSPGLPGAAFNGGILRLMRGMLEVGWDGYDRRFDTRDVGGAARLPGGPVWTGDDPAGRRVLVWREQGIGDEMMFAGCLPDLIARAGHVVVECDRRLVPLYARSFPQATVRPAPGRPDTPAEGVDCHVAAGSLPRFLRRSLADFSPEPGCLRADGGAVAAWRRRVAALGSGLAVGVAWRSGQLDPDRMPDYTRLEDWGPVLAVPGVVFVNLQYGDCAEELAAAQRRFGVSPHAFADLDLRNDLDGGAALTSALDLVIAPATSTGELAGALGVPVWRLGRRGDWTGLGTGVRPWFPSMRVFPTRDGEQVADLLPAVAGVLRRLSQQRS
ncbi:tetratricopeptide repeat protein [Azospirillum doebereinerae]|uniref:tetratricopeptide repeat protein n=1 Tax=Azospirillum doebereinerae TaxID=92933 RepID=UPI001EE61500|nr:tetratricopeptide repeat protein [Azospirillum doebereinerae]MCG5238500.1 tetratricopeptide repeat protein [Azospirillum doebereinerae]